MTTNNETLAGDLAKAEDAIAELETKLAFQEHTIEALNEALSSQQMQIDKMQYQLRGQC